MREIFYTLPSFYNASVRHCFTKIFPNQTFIRGQCFVNSFVFLGMLCSLTIPGLQPCVFILQGRLSEGEISLHFSSRRSSPVKITEHRDFLFLLPFYLSCERQGWGLMLMLMFWKCIFYLREGAMEFGQWERESEGRLVAAHSLTSSSLPFLRWHSGNSFADLFFLLPKFFRKSIQKEAILFDPAVYSIKQGVFLYEFEN